MSTNLDILPSAAAVALRRKGDLLGREVLFGTPAMTLKGLTEAILRVSQGAKRQLSTAGQKMLIAAIVAKRYRDKGGHYQPLADSPGFTSTLAGFFAELKRSCLTPEEFLATAGRLPARKRLTELGELYASYEKALLDLGLMDSNDAERHAISHLQSGGKLPPILKGIDTIRLHAIYDLTPQQLSLVSQLAARIKVVINLPYNPEREEIYAYTGRTAAMVEALDNSMLDMELEFSEPSAPFLDPILTALDRGEPTPLPGPLKLFAAPGTYRECEEIGRRVRLMMEEGVDPAAIAVACREMSSIGPMFEDVCRRFRIPVSYRRGTPLAISPLVKACLAPFRVIASRYGRDELLALYNSSYTASGQRSVAPAQVEEVILKAGYIDETTGRLMDLLKRRCDNLGRKGRSVAREEGVIQALAPLLEELHAMATHKTIHDHAAALNRHIKRRDYYRRGISAADERALKRDASAITLFRQALIDLENDARLLGLEGRPIGPAEFSELLQQGLQGVSLAGERRAGVTIMNFHEARGLSFPHLFIAGLNEGVCPARHDPHPFFKEEDKALFQHASGRRLFRSTAEKRLEEPLLFYLAIGTAGNSLTFSYSYIDGQGKELLPSPFLEEMTAAMAIDKERVAVNTLIPELENCLEREELLNSLALRGHIQFHPVYPLPIRESLDRISESAEIERGRERFFQESDPLKRGLLATPYTGSLQADLIRAGLNDHYSTPPGNSFAPTALEEYGACPFRYFLKRLLKLVPMEAPGLEPDPRDRGSLIHIILQEFFRKMKEKGELPLTGRPDELEELRRTMDHCFGQWETEHHTGAPLLWEMARNQLTPILEALIEAEGRLSSPLVPEECELGFEGFPVSAPDGSAIFLHGKLDRLDLDIAEGNLRVVDYKLSGDKGNYQKLLREEAMGETSFQMPVYLLAAVREMEERTGRRFRHGHAFYWLLRKLLPLDQEFDLTPSGPDAGFFATAPDRRLELGEANFLNRLCAKVKRMKDGDFQITPTDGCGHCEFGAVCRHVAGGLKTVTDAGE
jgi:ATP-dependent helicase/DNAse subunit B